MNSRERFLSALQGRRPDRTPLAHVAALTTLELQEQTGCFMPRVHTDPEQLVRLCGANHDVLGFDAVTFIISYFSEPAALGAQISYGGKDELPIYTSHPWEDPSAAAIPANVLDREPIRVYLEALRLAKLRYGDRIAVLGKVMGPFSMALVMHGLEKMMIGLIDDPSSIRHLLNVSAEILVKCANAQFETGIDALAIGEGGAGANMLSPAMYEEILMPVHQKLVREIHGPTIMHICGDITPRLPCMRKLGLTCFNFDWAIQPDAMKRAAEEKFRLMGNVNTSDLLIGQPAQIETQVNACLEAGVEIISPGCAISPKCPNANLLALRPAIQKWHEQNRSK
jgi:MtaA/CmuA family methyltransferase